MSKRRKNFESRQAQSHFTRNGFVRRPVTKDDKWCKFPDPNYEEKLDPSAPYGYLVVIPSYCHGMELDLDGYIIKSRLFKKTLFLQVVMATPRGNGRRYSTEIYAGKLTKKRRRARSEFLNIRNLNKGLPKKR